MLRRGRVWIGGMHPVLRLSPSKRVTNPDPPLYCLYASQCPYRPLIRPKGLRGTVPVKEIRKAVREVMEMEKNDPAAYEAMVKRNAHRKIRIVPDRG